MDAFFLRIFDAIVGFEPLDKYLFSHTDTAKLRKIYQKIFNRETVVYVVFGVLTTIVNFVTSAVATSWLNSTSWQGSLHFFSKTKNYAYLDANMIAWVVSFLFAFVTNKLWVFSSKSWSPHLVWREFTPFLAARLFSLGVDQLCMFLLVSVFSFRWGLSKLISQFIIVVINYVFSKLFVFKNTSKTPGNASETDAAEAE